MEFIHVLLYVEQSTPYPLRHQRTASKYPVNDMIIVPGLTGKLEVHTHTLSLCCIDPITIMFGNPGFVLYALLFFICWFYFSYTYF